MLAKCFFKIHHTSNNSRVYGGYIHLGVPTCTHLYLWRFISTFLRDI